MTVAGDVNEWRSVGEFEWRRVFVCLLSSPYVCHIPSLLSFCRFAFFNTVNTVYVDGEDVKITFLFLSSLFFHLPSQRPTLFSFSFPISCSPFLCNSSSFLHLILQNPNGMQQHFASSTSSEKGFRCRFHFSTMMSIAPSPRWGEGCDWQKQQPFYKEREGWFGCCKITAFDGWSCLARCYKGYPCFS